jgi:hypothetical protein
MRVFTWFCLVGLSIGCESGGNKVPTDTGLEVGDADGSSDVDDTGTGSVDADDDGFNVGEDCDDTDGTVFPGAEEVPYDAIDQDCDGADLTDVDGDGQAWVGVLDGTDCDDGDLSVYEGAEEVPYDGIDQDCDGADITDIDGDGVDAIEAGGLDCDDADPDIHPGVEDVPYDGIDQDCSGTDLTDVDDDGHDGTAIEGGDDCDDLDPTISPSAEETPYDGIDDDCDGSDLTDVDGDGYDGLAVDGTDCDDDDALSYPGATEVAYDGIDQDCSGADLTDVDGDGEDWDGVTGGTDCDDGDSSISTAGTEIPYDGVDDDCSGADLTDVDGDGYDAEVVDGDDCDDYDDDVYPEAPELDDGDDNDCDVLIDEDFIGSRDILINEVMANPGSVGDSYGEWLELYNDSDRSINMVGWSLRRSGSDFADMTIDGDLSVDAGDYVVLGVNADEDTNGGIQVDYAYSWGDFTLVNDGYAFYLEMGTASIHSVGAYSLSGGITATEGAAYGFEYRSSGWLGSIDNWCDQQAELDSGDLGTPGAINDVCEDMSCVDGGRVMGDFSDDTTGASDTSPYSECTPWFATSPDLTFAYTAESSGCYKFSAGDPDEDWHPTVVIGSSCDAFSSSEDNECDDAWSSGGWGLSYYYDATVYQTISSGDTWYMLVQGTYEESLTLESGEFDASIEEVAASYCDDEAPTIPPMEF